MCHQARHGRSSDFLLKLRSYINQLLRMGRSLIHVLGSPGHLVFVKGAF